MCVGWSWSDGKMVLHDGEVSESYFLPCGSLQELYAVKLALLGLVYQVSCHARFDFRSRYGL